MIHNQNKLYMKHRSRTTIKPVSQYLAKYLRRVQISLSNQVPSIIRHWEDIVGEDLASMSKVIGIRDQVLLISVANSSIYAILQRQDKKDAILTKVRQCVPSAKIKKIQFLLT